MVLSFGLDGFRGCFDMFKLPRGRRSFDGPILFYGPLELRQTLLKL